MMYKGGINMSSDYSNLYVYNMMLPNFVVTMSEVEIEESFYIFKNQNETTYDQMIEIIFSNNLTSKDISLFKSLNIGDVSDCKKIILILYIMSSAVKREGMRYANDLILLGKIGSYSLMYRNIQLFINLLIDSYKES